MEELDKKQVKEDIEFMASKLRISMRQIKEVYDKLNEIYKML
jgi:hypothetical protein